MVFACIFWINNMKSWCWRSHRFCFFSLISSCFRFNSRYGSFLPCRYSIASENIDLLFLGFSSPLFYLLNLIGSVLEFLLALHCFLPHTSGSSLSFLNFIFMVFIFILTLWFIILLFLDEFLKKHVNLGSPYLYATSSILLVFLSNIFLFKSQNQSFTALWVTVKAGFVTSFKWCNSFYVYCKNASLHKATALDPNISFSLKYEA